MQLTKEKPLCIEEEFSVNSPEKKITIPEDISSPANLKFSNFSNAVMSINGYSINGKKLYCNLEQLISDIIDRTVSIEEQVLTILTFLAQKAYGHPSPHPGMEAHDPIKLLHIYGYGLCDDFSTVFYTICQAVGIPARVISLDGHVIPEVKYDGKWHMLDASEASIYRDSTGVIAGVEDIENDLSLLNNPEGPNKPSELFGRSFSVDRLKEIYGNRNTTRDLTWYYSSLLSNTHEVAINLRPGETINFDFESHESVFRTCNSPEIPPIFGNGTINYSPLLNKQTRMHTVENNSLSTLDESEKAIVFINSSSKENSIEFPFISPFPFLKGSMNINLNIFRGIVSIEFSLDKETWKPIWNGGTDTSISRINKLSWNFINFDGNRSSSQFIRIVKQVPSGRISVNQDSRGFPSYQFFVRFRLQPGTEVLLNNIETSLLFQFAPLNLPVLLGGDNSIKLNLEGNGTLTMSQNEGGGLCAY